MPTRYVAVITLLLSAAVAPTAAQADKWSKWWGYAIPVSCGEAGENDTAAVEGAYRTAITAINMDRRSAEIRAEAMLTVPQRAASLPLKRTVPGVSAVTVDCADLADLFTFETPPASAGYRQGVIMLHSARPLEIQVQTTVLGLTGGPSISMQTIAGKRHVRPRNWSRRDRDAVAMCHIPPGNPARAHTIIVDPASVSAHLAHGDYRGSCEDD